MMINLDPMDYKYGTSYTEAGETRSVMEVHELSKWEAIRMLISMEKETFHEDRPVAWQMRCTLAQAKYVLLRECQNAYLDLLK